MTAKSRIFAAAAGLLLIGNPALAQKPGGTLKIYFFDSPATAATIGNFIAICVSPANCGDHARMHRRAPSIPGGAAGKPG